MSDDNVIQLRGSPPPDDDLDPVAAARAAAAAEIVGCFYARDISGVSVALDRFERVVREQPGTLRVVERDVERTSPLALLLTFAVGVMMGLMA